MFKRLITAMVDHFKPVEEKTRNVMHDYTFVRRQPGHDISISITGDGEYAKAVVVGSDFQQGDILAFDPEGVVYHFIIDTVEEVGKDVYSLEMHRFELGEE